MGLIEESDNVVVDFEREALTKFSEAHQNLGVDGPCGDLDFTSKVVHPFFVIRSIDSDT